MLEDAELMVEGLPAARAVAAAPNVGLENIDCGVSRFAKDPRLFLNMAVEGEGRPECIAVDR